MIDSTQRLSSTCGIPAAFLLLVLTASCSELDNARRTVADPDAFVENAERSSQPARSAVKAHMPDGSVYVLSVWTLDLSERMLHGTGHYFGVQRDTLRSGRLSVAVDSAALIETNVRRTSISQTFAAVLTGATAGLALYCATNPKACFGSCPTIYHEGLLEAESFSHSIAPLFETRDVDRLEAVPGSNGLLTLEVRNEALETHYINHLELLEVRHQAGSYALPGPDGQALILSDVRELASAVDRDGASAIAAVSAKDGDAYETAPAILQQAAQNDPFDRIDVAVPWDGADTAAVLLDFRASLLSTVLFYDYMMRGIGAIEWLTQGLDTIEGAVEIGQFYQRWMGIRVSVADGSGYREVGRIGGAGPIAWDEAALAIPVPTDTDTLRLRLSFLADAFRFDRIAVAADVERKPARVLPASEVSARSPNASTNLRAELAHPDEAYAVPYPGSSFEVVFDVAAENGDVVDERRDGPRVEAGTETDIETTYFVASQGYYIEWIRRSWLQESTPDHLAGGELVAAALRRWVDVKQDYESLFFETRIPVR